MRPFAWRPSFLTWALTVAVVLLLGPGLTSASAGAPSPQAPGPPELLLESSSATGVTFDAMGPSNYWNTPITSYTIIGEPGDITVQVPVHHGDFLVSGLSVGTTYTFTAVANTDAYGPGYPSDPVTVTPSPNPNLPARPVTHLTSVGDGSVHAAWQPPADDGGSPVLSYTVQWRDPDVSPLPAYQTATVPASQLSYDIPGLSDKTTYDVDVLATNAVGDSGWFGDGVYNVLTPQPPTDLQMTAAGPNQLQVSWTPPATGSQIASYLVTASDPADSSHDVSMSTTDTQATLNVLNDTSYAVQVFAIDASTAPSPPVTGQAPMARAIPPDAPSLAVVSSGSGKVQLQVTPPAYDGGAPVTSYTIVDSSHRIARPAESGINTVAGAISISGSSAASGTVTVTPLGAPGAPRLAAKPSWYALAARVSAPAFNGGSPVTRYTVTLSGPGIATKTLARATPGAVVFTGLAPLTTYTLRATALNVVGTSTQTVAGVRTTALPAVVYIPNTPRTTVLVPGQSVMLYWKGIFSIGSATLNATARAELSNLAHELTGDKAIVCKGFADTGVNSVANYWLGLTRAVNMCNTLNADGVKAATSIISYGGTHPMWSRLAVAFVQS
jgi:hypothetical protein